MIDPLAVKKMSNRLYRIWTQMKRRCNGDKHVLSDNYVARGITYCDRWKSFDAFYEDMREGYAPNLSLDRIDNNKGYDPENCRWATAKEQANNTSRNIIFTINGETKTLAQWIDSVKLKSSTVRQRYYGLNWSIEDSLFAPANSRLSKKEG